MMNYRGSMPEPKYQHGESIQRGGTTGVVLHRNWTRLGWEYGLQVPGSVMILWVKE